MKRIASAKRFSRKLIMPWYTILTLAVTALMSLLMIYQVYVALCHIEAVYEQSMFQLSA